MCSICGIESQIDIFAKVIADILKKICFALMPRLAAYFSSEVFSTELELTTCIVNNSQPYVLAIIWNNIFTRIFADGLDRLAHLRVTRQPFEIICSKISFLKGLGTL